MMESMIDAPAPPSAGGRRARAARGLVRPRRRHARRAGRAQIIVRIGKHVVAEEPLRGRSFSLDVPMPTRRRRGARDRGRRPQPPLDRASSSPCSGFRPAPSRAQRSPTLDPALARTVRSLVRRHGGTAGVYVQDLRTGRGAAWNAARALPRRVDAQARDRGHGDALARRQARRRGRGSRACSAKMLVALRQRMRRTSSRSGSPARPRPARTG